MKKTFLTLPLLILALAFVVSCGDSKNTDVEVAVEMERHVAQELELFRDEIRGKGGEKGV